MAEYLDSLRIFPCFLHPPHTHTKDAIGEEKWFLDRTKSNGFKIVGTQENHPEFDIVNREWKLLRHKGSGTARLSCVTFEGILEITDLKKFKNAMINGIGREKAYGMGLLTVIPM